MTDMTEQEWHSWTNPRAMLYFLGEGAGYRRFRLFACPCVILPCALIPNARYRHCEALTEKLIDGAAPVREHGRAYQAARSVKDFDSSEPSADWAVMTACQPDPPGRVPGVIFYLAVDTWDCVSGTIWEQSGRKKRPFYE